MPEFDRFDILALPTAQVFPFSKDVHWPESINGRQMDTYHRWMEVVIGDGDYTEAWFGWTRRPYDLSTVYTKVL